MCVEPFAGNRGASFSLLCANHRKNRQCKPWLTNAPGFERRILSDPLHVDELVEMSKTHIENGQKTQTCPWKAARNAAKEAQVIVCDYNHLFIEGVRTASLKAMGLRLDDLVVIVDEAHNLPDRVRMGMQTRITPAITIFFPLRGASSRSTSSELMSCLLHVLDSVSILVPGM